MKRGMHLAALLAMLVTVSLAGHQAAAQQAAAVDSQVAQAKAALARYQDPIAAVFDGYFSTLVCIEFPQPGGMGQMAYKAGGMGVHFLNLNLVGQKLDPAHPQVLIYEPAGDKLALVAAEWFVPVAPGVTEAPKVLGQTLQGPMEGHAPIMPAGLHHWDLHAWLWKANPSGMFSPTNPNVKCPKTGYSYAGDPPKVVH